jgi:hypothetical protein
MKLAHAALAAVTALTLSAAPFAQAEARDWHGHGGWHHGDRGWSNGAYFGLGALTTAALLSRPRYAYYDDPYYYPRRAYYAPRPVYYDPYYPPATVVYERW